MQEDRDDVKGGNALSVYLIETEKNVGSAAQIKSNIPQEGSILTWN